MITIEYLDSLSRDELVEGLLRGVGTEREAQVRVIGSLARMEREGLERELGFDDLEAYCAQELPYTEHEAAARIAAARAVNKQPGILDDLQTRALNLTGVGIIADYLTKGPAGTELVAAARHKTGNEIRRLLDGRFPKLRQRRTHTELRVRSASHGRVRLSVVVAPEVAEKLRHARALAIASNPNCDVETVLSEALDLLVASLSDRAARRPHRPKASTTRESAEGVGSRAKDAKDAIEATWTQPDIAVHGPGLYDREWAEVEHKVFIAMIGLGYDRRQASLRSRHAMMKLGPKAPIDALCMMALVRRAAGGNSPN